MDMFFVAVELRRRPELRGLPVVVGSDGNRGVVAAASYEARRFGVFSAMPASRARKLCPQAVFLPGDMDEYVEVSGQVFDIFHDFTPLVEGLSLDEAFLDVSGSKRSIGSGTEIAATIRQRVLAEVGLPSSVGVATCKFIAKLASKFAKPVASSLGVAPGFGVYEVLHGDELAFIRPMHVKSLWGVGPVTLEKLTRLGIAKISDLAEIDLRALQGIVGESHAQHLHDLAHARDSRDVEPNRESKSIGNEETFSDDVFSIDELRTHLVRLADSVARRCREDALWPRTCTLKIKYSNFQSITRSHTEATPVTSAQALLKMIEPLLATIEVTRGVRLVGISTRNFDVDGHQLSLFDEGIKSENASELDEAWAPATQAIDEIRERFGDGAIRPASTLRPGHEPEGTHWGPRMLQKE
jgi:DNA polymerase-4